MLSQEKKSYVHLFWQLLKTDLHIYRKAMIDSFIDSTVWFTCTIIIFAHIFPLLGMQRGFSIFIAIGAIISCSFWNIWSTSTHFISDIEGNKTINYFLSLPIPNELVLVKQVLGYAIKAGTPSLLILPLGKILLWKQMDLSNFAPIKFAILFIIANIFVGSLSLVITSYIESLHHIGKVGIRFLFPMWFFGGANYSWAIIYKLSPAFAYATLCNPLIYAMEGIRSAILGPEGYLSFWLCILMLILFTALFCAIGIKRFRKRLDFV